MRTTTAKEPRQPLGAAFANIFTANLVSSLGDGVVRTAVPLLAVTLTHDAFLISGIAALAMLPWLLFAIPSGILIDKIDRRLAMALANTVRGLLGATLLVLVATGTLTIWSLYGVTFVAGIAETIYDGAIRAVVPGIVEKSNLPRANGRIEAGETIVLNFLSAPFTSVLFGVSVLIPLGVNVAAFAVAVVLAVLLPVAASGRQFKVAPVAGADGSPREPWWRQFVEGFRFITGNRMLVILWLLSTFTGLAISAATASFVLYLVQRVGLPPSLFGVFLLSGAAGAIIGSLIVDRVKRLLGAGLTMAIGNVTFSLAIFVIGLAPQLWLAALGFFLSSVGVILWNVLVMSLRQSIIPGRLLGRVHGTWRTLLWGAMPIGSLLGGLLGRVDLSLPFLVGGGVATVASLVFFRFVTRLPNPEDVDNGDRPAEALPTQPLVEE
ncbi:MAG TPA: MFS transporter [Pseudolysinimonas sp.]|jgi:MFS family permease